MEIQILKSILEINQAEWQRLRADSFPFTSYEFLSALERTGCLGPRTGWEPQFIVIRQQGSLKAVLVNYLRSNSFGEFIFDFAWADAFHRYGSAYYPKLVSAIPFTPATGSKLLMWAGSSDQEKSQLQLELLKAAADFCRSNKLSSQHALFISSQEIPAFTEANFFIRHSFQYHWKNASYKSFAEFLAKLRSKRRNEILRERGQVEKNGIKISRLTGKELTSRHAEIMYDFYISTMDKKSGFDFLTGDFFAEIFNTMKDQILFVLAEDSAGKAVAGAINYMSDKALYGRHWGCLADYKALHFEVCYYQGIEYCIERGFELFEAGAQGDHKFNRGFLPELTYSAHFIAQQEFAAAIQNAVEREKKQLELFFKDCEEHTPFSRAPALKPS